MFYTDSTESLSPWQSAAVAWQSENTCKPPDEGADTPFGSQRRFQLEPHNLTDCGRDDVQPLWEKSVS